MNTPIRTIRVGDRLWTWAKHKGEGLGKSVTWVVKAALLNMASNELSPDEAKKLLEEDNDD